MRREERVTAQGPVKEQQPDGMSHRGGGGAFAGAPDEVPRPLPAPSSWEMIVVLALFGKQPKGNDCLQFSPNTCTSNDVAMILTCLDSGTPPPWTPGVWMFVRPTRGHTSLIDQTKEAS